MDYVYTFMVGGAICVIGQILMDRTKLTTPRVLVIFVVSGVVLQALQLYEPLVKLAHQGATVPLPGFGYALAKGAMEGAEKGLLGVVQGAVKSTAAGITVAVAWGYLLALFFESKTPK